MGFENYYIEVSLNDISIHESLPLGSKVDWVGGGGGGGTQAHSQTDTETGCWSHKPISSL
jgi:hypothetical protein